ncbi:MAG TPA: bacillithiol biosynthesis BshC [Thermoanaerobaculia bacterium]
MSTIPFDRYPNLSPLFLDFLKGLPRFFPDPPTLDAAEARARQILETPRPPRVPASAYRFRGGASGESARLAGEIAAGRAVAVQTGHQVGLFTGPLFTLMKALDAVHVARELRRRGVPAVAVFWALTDDHDLQEIAQTAKPGPEGPQVFVLEGADRQNRQPVGRLPIPDGVRAIVDAFGADAKTPEAAAVLDAFARRSAPGTLYGEAFIETLLDLVEPDPLLIVDPISEPLRRPTVELFREAVRLAPRLRATLEETERALRDAGKPIPAPLPVGFSFFTIPSGGAEGRRRITDVAAAAARVESGEALPSADVITRPVLKSYLFPMAVSILGAAEIAYHAQSLPLFSLFGLPAPILMPRTHVVVRGPAERRLAEQLQVADEDLLVTLTETLPVAVPQADTLGALGAATEKSLAGLGAELERLDPSLLGALENASKKIAHQFEQLADRARKAAGRRDDVVTNRRKRLERALLPAVGGVPAERVYPPLCGMMAFGREDVLASLRSVAGTGARGAAVVEWGLSPVEDRRAG